MKLKISVMVILLISMIVIVMQSDEVEGGITDTAKRFVESVGEKMGFGNEENAPVDTSTLHTHTTTTADTRNPNEHHLRENTAEFAQDKLGEAKEKVGDFAENTRDYVQNFAGDVKDNVKDKMGNAKEKVEDYAENIKENAGNFAENMKEKMRSSKERFKDNAENMKENARYRMGNAKERIENFADNVKDKMGNAKEKVEDYAENIKENAGNFAENVKEKMGYAKDKIVDTAENIAEKVLPQELIDMADPISETFQNGVLKVRRNLNKISDWKNKMTEKMMSFLSQQGEGTMTREEMKENDLIINWAKREGFDEIIPMLRAKQYDFDKLSTINTSNIKDEFGVTDPSYATRIVDSIDVLFDGIGVTNVDEEASLL